MNKQEGKKDENKILKIHEMQIKQSKIKNNGNLRGKHPARSSWIVI